MSESEETVRSPSPPKARPVIRLNRRQLVAGSGAALATSGAATLGAATVMALQATPVATPTAEMPLDQPMEGPQRPIEFFNPHEAATVDALVSRILPGSADDPGAHEAGVVFFIDRVLAGPNLGYSLKTYKDGPYSVVSEEQVPVEAVSQPTNYEFISIAADQVSRYGFQSKLTPQEIYRRGIEFVDAYAQEQFESDFVDLDPDQQDQILTDMEADTATGFEGPSGSAFFTWLRNDTIEGMFSDPMYGGNRDLVGWKLIGYPGAQRLYTPEDMQNPNFSRPPQSLAQLMANENH
jgi:gluconate 2-dehydrogenase gamma chain